MTAELEEGPLEGRKPEVEPIEGRPPKTINVPAGDGVTYRYGLSEWTQSGSSAAYEFLYLV